MRASGVIDIVSQIAILVFSLSAMWLANAHRPKIRRWGCVIGLFCEPFWFYTTFIHQQWGIFVAAFFYTGGWAYGFYNQWIRK